MMNPLGVISAIEHHDVFNEYSLASIGHKELNAVSGVGMKSAELRRF
jgi:hypothetical protein